MSKVKGSVVGFLDRRYAVRLAELSLCTGVSVATLKFYLREGLLHPGKPISRSQAGYDDTHRDRLQLILALRDVGGLPLATIGRVLNLLSSPGLEHGEAIQATHRTLPYQLAPVESGSREESTERAAAPEGAESRAQAWLLERGWTVDPLDPMVEQLERAWTACDDLGLTLDTARMDVYADHIEAIAKVDVDSLPLDAGMAIRHVVLGTVMVEPVLAALRRLAHHHVCQATGRAESD